MKDHKSWAIKDEMILDDLVTLLDLSLIEQASLGELQEPACLVAPQLSKMFYQRLLGYPLTAKFFHNQYGQIETRRKTLEEWFVQLFQGIYDQHYVQSRLSIGQMHLLIDVPVRYPLVMMDVMLGFGMKVIDQSSQPETATAAFRKLFALDIAIFNQAYEDAQLKHLAGIMGDERLARRLLQQ